MILNQLVRLYDRLANEGADDLPRYGWSIERVSFAIRITRDGDFVGFADLRQADGNRSHPVPMKVPAHATRAVNILPFFLCDSPSYLLGRDPDGNPTRISECYAQSRLLHQRLSAEASADSPLRSVAAFFDRWSPGMADNDDNLDDVLTKGFLIFQIDGEERLVHEHNTSSIVWDAEVVRRDTEAERGSCLVTGEFAPIERVHSRIKGVHGAQSAGAAIVSFNFNAAEFFGKEQGANAPISKSAAFRYAAVLNRLVKGRTNRVVVDDLTVVFWSDAPTPFETLFGFAVGGATDRDLDDRTSAVWQSVRGGTKAPELDASMPFYVLGLGANSSRVVVRFWLTGTVGQFAENLGQHLRDFAVEKQFPGEGDRLPIRLIVRECRRRYTGSGKERKPVDPDSHPGLSKSLLRAVLYGGAYPQALLVSAIGRMRADGEVNRVRMATVKGILCRAYRKRNKEVPVALDENYGNSGYQLGRLFAALEKAQRDALGGINATIKDRYFGAASATPRRVFPLLIRLSQHHVAKSEWGHVADKRIEEIMQHIGEFPVHLSLEDQGFFALGYYHQRNAFYSKKESTKETADE